MEDQVLVLGSSKESNVYVVDPSCGGQLFTFKGSTTNRHGMICVPNTNHLVMMQHQKLAIHFHQWGKDNVSMKCHVTEKMGPFVTTSCGQFCIAGAASGKMYIWMTGTGQLINVWDAHYKAVSAISLTSDDGYIVSGGEDAVVNVWSLLDLLDSSDVATAVFQQGISPIVSWTDHTLPITSIHCGMGGINGRIFTSSLDRTCKIWEIPTGKRIYSITCPSYVNFCTTDKMEHRLFIGCGDGAIYTVHLHAAAASIHATTARLTSSNSMTQAMVWDKEPLQKAAFIGHEAPVTALILTSCGGFLISGDDEGSVRVWDTMTQQTVRSINILKSSISSMLLLPRPSTLFHADKLRSNDSDLPIAPFKKYMNSGNE